MFCLIQFHSCLTKSLLQEPDELSGVVDDTRGSLLMMNFSVEEVEFAIHKLGMRIFYLNCCFVQLVYTLLLYLSHICHNYFHSVLFVIDLETYVV